MACQNSNCSQSQGHECNTNNYNNSCNFVIIVVLYILLAIIISSCVWY